MPISLQTIRQEVGFSLDDLAVYSATSGTSSAVTIAALISAATNAATNRMDGAWFYNATKGLQRKARTNGHVPLAGATTVDPTWTSPGASDRIEVTHLFPCDAQVLDSDTSYNTFIRRASMMGSFPDRISLPISTVAAPGLYTLFTYPWLDRQSRYGWPPRADGTPEPLLLEPGPTGVPIPADWRRPHLELSVGQAVLRLDVPYEAGTNGNLLVNVMRPWGTYVTVSGVAAESTTGPVDETDQINCQLNDIVAIARWLAIKDLVARGVSSSSGRWDTKLADAEAAARRVLYFDRTAEIPPPAVAQPAGQVA